jgi:actin-related protein 3
MTDNKTPAVIIDNGTGYTKMGYGGNMQPSYQIPSIIATPMDERTSVRGGPKFND